MSKYQICLQIENIYANTCNEEIVMCIYQADGKTKFTT